MLSGNVYHDRSNDGVFDRASEEGIAGVVVKLLDESGNDTGLRATTNAQGFYKFNNLKAASTRSSKCTPAAGSTARIRPVIWAASRPRCPAT
jgi:hypothetical protein